MPKAKNDKETLEMWATDLLQEAHAIVACPDHGYMRLRHSQHAIDYCARSGEAPEVLRQKQEGARCGG